jgi:hypothetical protein
MISASNSTQIRAASVSGLVGWRCSVSLRFMGHLHEETGWDLRQPRLLN